MNIITNIFKSSLGKKYLMAVTGFLLFLFVVGHLAGNLQVFLGPEAINRYGHFLQSNMELLWPVRVALLLILLVHIWAAAKLSLENKAARPVGYAVYEPVGSTYASRTMLMSGSVVFVFVVYHLLHYTVQVQYLNLTGQDFAAFFDSEKRHDVFKMMVVGFNNPWVAGFYILGMALLCLHLSHGVSSMFQSLGLKNETYRPLLDQGARALAALIFLGYTSIPVAILCGYGRWALK
ncbi:MAG TPA: succinate dehydrogenase cytochrome b subunit [Candidatus Acidoferrum sp.]|jgi:succinate dehydrogenase / fumarate reductase cytochrome b subunit|nr:succinate dehydrogenase cytochrome b subunit [Candidatus Acidoferrum sp.]